MARTMLLALLLQCLVQYPQMVGDGLDEAMRARMELRADYLDQQMTRLLQELEQGPLERALHAWGALLWAAPQQWHFWALAAGPGLLLALCFICSRAVRNRRARRAREEALRRRRESIQMMLTIRRRYREMKEIWAYLKEMKKKVTRAMETKKRKKSMLVRGKPVTVAKPGFPAVPPGTFGAHALLPGQETP